MSNRFLPPLLLALGAFSLSACISQGEGYVSTQHERELQCHVFTGTEREDCLEHARVPYGDVQKQRREDSRSES